MYVYNQTKGTLFCEIMQILTKGGKTLENQTY